MKFETKMSSNLDFAERIRLSLYQHVGYCVCVCVCVCVCMRMRACILVCMLTGHKLRTIIPQLQLSFMTFLLVGFFTFLEMTLSYWKPVLKEAYRTMSVHPSSLT